MGGSGAFNYGQSSQSSQAASGLQNSDYTPQAQAQTYNAGLKLNQTVDQANSDLTKYNGQTGAQLLPGGQYGMGSNMDAAVQQYGKYMFGQASGSAGQRGQLSPENLAGVTGSAVQNSLPTLMPYIQQWQMAQFQAPVSLNQASVQNAQAPGTFWNQALGAQSQSQGSGFNFGVSGGGACWVAEALYGKFADETLLARKYANNNLWKPLLNLYKKVGRQVARHVSTHTWSRILLKPLFDIMVWRAKAHYEVV